MAATNQSLESLLENNLKHLQSICFSKTYESSELFEPSEALKIFKALEDFENLMMNPDFNKYCKEYNDEKNTNSLLREYLFELSCKVYLDAHKLIMSALKANNEHTAITIFKSLGASLTNHKNNDDKQPTLLYLVLNEAINKKAGFLTKEIFESSTLKCAHDAQKLAQKVLEELQAKPTPSEGFSTSVKALATMLQRETNQKIMNPAQATGNEVTLAPKSPSKTH